MNHKAHFKGDIQVDGSILGPDGQPIGGGIGDWATFTFDDTYTVPKALADSSDVYPLLKVLYSQGDAISLGIDKKTISLAAGLYEVNVAYALQHTGSTAGRFQVYMDNDTYEFDAVGTIQSLAIMAAENTQHNETVTLVTPVLTDDHWQLNFLSNGTGGVNLLHLLMTITRRGDLPA